MADDEVTPLTTATTNYGWVKPDVGASDDVWGGQLNSDLDGIDSIVHGIDIRPSGGAIASATPPGSPTVGMLWFDSVGGQTYVWYNDGNTSQWVIAVNAGASLLPASTTVLGGVKVDGTTIQAATDGTISVVTVPIGDNRIINGDMRIDQRNNGASGTVTNSHTVDRWVYAASQTGKGAWQRFGPGSPVTTGFPYNLGFTSSSAYASLTTDVFTFYQKIEADMVSDFAWGTASAQPVTLSFWANSSLTGIFGGAVGNEAATRSYPFSFSLPTANTWTKIVVLIPGDTAGTWVMSGNAASTQVSFDLGTGATYRGPANAWASANYVGVTGAVSVVATNSAAFYLTGVKLEIGSVATSYNRQSLAKSLADCQRYYNLLSVGPTGGYAGVGGQFVYFNINMPPMRGSPTVAYQSITYNFNSSTLANTAITPANIASSFVCPAIGGGAVTFNVSLSAEL